jgi:5-formyltetrahydrofolate cyclo-ligase
VVDDLPPIPLDDGPDPKEIRKAKRSLRREIARRVRGMSAEDRARESTAVCEHILGSPQYAAARSVLMYHALEDEVDLGTLIDEAVQSGREVLLPVVGGGAGEMKVVSVHDPARDLRDGAFGIMEPKGGMPLEDLSGIDLVLVPGRAFDREGGRLGRGGGYYDRFLRRLRPQKAGGPPKLGVAFGCQVVESVPRTGMDVLTDGLVTEGSSG